jgi:hypothetical protein
MLVNSELCTGYTDLRNQKWTARSLPIPFGYVAQHICVSKSFFSEVFWVIYFALRFLRYDRSCSVCNRFWVWSIFLAFCIISIFYFVKFVLIGISTTDSDIWRLAKPHEPHVLMPLASVLPSSLFWSSIFFGEEANPHISFYTMTLKLKSPLSWLHQEFFEINLNQNAVFENPAQLFVLSFLSIILLGSFLPRCLSNATANGICRCTIHVYQRGLCDWIRL